MSQVTGERGSGPMYVASRTPLAIFRAAQDFRFRQANASEAAGQKGQGGSRYLTSAAAFVNGVLTRDPAQFRILDPAHRLRCLAPGRWATARYTGRRVLFLLPSQALGGNVATALFLRAFRAQHRPAAIGVFCAQSTADIYLAEDGIDVFTLWIGERELKRWDATIDLGHLESRRDIEVWPVDMEADLLAAFAIPPAELAVEARPVPAGPLRIGVLPLATSPLRTLPVPVTQALLEALRPYGRTVLCLNRFQQQGVLYRQALGDTLPAHVEAIDAFASIGELLAAVAGFDYAVFADSGPAHMAKLNATPGLAVYTSAPAEVLQGRFRNLSAWQVSYAGSHCRAPCGLAKLRVDAGGRIGCMGSLELPLEALPDTPRRQDADTVRRLLLEAPVPCVAALGQRAGEVAAAVVADLERRRGAGLKAS